MCVSPLKAGRQGITGDIHPFGVEDIAGLAPVTAKAADRERRSIGEHRDAIDLPATQKRVYHAAVIQQAFPFSEGQLPKPAQDDTPGLVEIRHATLQIEIV